MRLDYLGRAIVHRVAQVGVQAQEGLAEVAHGREGGSCGDRIDDVYVLAGSARQSVWRTLHMPTVLSRQDRSAVVSPPPARHRAVPALPVAASLTVITARRNRSVGVVVGLDG